MKDKYVKQVLWNCEPLGGYQCEEKGWIERVKESEYGLCILYTCLKIEQWNLLKLF
jgi:hypothetical protein